MLHLRAVNTRWKEVIEFFYRSKRSLYLWNGKPTRFEYISDEIWLDQKEFVHYDLVNKKFGRDYENFLDFCAFLHRLFPNIERLVIDDNKYYENLFNPDNLLFLLNHWSSTLTTMSLKFWILEFFTPELYNSLNSMTQLKQLQMSNTLIFKENHFLQPLQPLLARLELFSAEFNKFPNQFELDSLLKQNCTGLSLNYSVGIFNIREWITLNPPFVGQLTHLRLGGFSGMEALELICQCAPALQVLDIVFYYIIYYYKVRTCLFWICFNLKFK